VVGVIDRDVILAREDVETEVVDLSWFCPGRTSQDGCNYSVVATAEIPVPPGAPPLVIEFTRGYVAVDAFIEDFPARVVNTHLEVRFPDPENPFSAIIQAAQAQELTFFLQNFSNQEGGPTILLGDINSSPVDQIIDDPDGYPFTDIVPPYMQFAEAGYFDTWTLRPGKPKGFTCCFGEDLAEPADLYERIDMIFSSAKPKRVKANVVGNSKSDRTISGLWPSDHAGVAGRLNFDFSDLP
jgi:endonuclease/exonuclease/phosphatase family metal-dependent hydrolase